MKTKQFDVAYRELKSGNHDPIYFLMGEDQFLHSYFINELANTLFKEDPIRAYLSEQKGGKK